MPSTSEKQARYMTANCKSPEFRKKTGMKKKVACDFHKADKGKYHEDEEMNRLSKLAGIQEEFISGERVYHVEQQRAGVVRGYEGDETAVEFDDEPGEIYYVDNAVLELINNEMAGDAELNRLQKLSGIEEALPHDYDVWKTQSGYENEPSERDINDAYEHLSSFIDEYLGKSEAQSYITSLKDPSMHPENIAGYKEDLFNDVVGYSRNALDQYNMLFFTDKELADFVRDKLKEKGILEGVEMNEKKLDERKLQHAIKTEDGEVPDTRSSDIGRMMRLAGINKKLDDDKNEGRVNFDGIFKGVARGDIDVKEDTEFDFLRTLEETKDEEVDEGKKRDVDGDGDIDSDDWKAAKDQAIKKSMKNEDVEVDEDEELEEVAPKGWEGTVKAMKKHPEIDEPYALAHHMKKKGYKSHKKEDIDVDEAKVSMDNPPTDVPKRTVGGVDVGQKYSSRARIDRPEEVTSRYGMPSGIDLDDYQEVDKVDFDRFVQDLEQTTLDKPDRLGRAGYGSTSFMYGPAGSGEVHAFVPDEGPSIQPAGTIPYYIRKDLLTTNEPADEQIMDNMFRETEHFTEGSLSRYMVEMIVDEMNKGTEAEEIAETLSFDPEHVTYIVEFVAKKHGLDEYAPATGKKFKGFDDEDKDDDDKDEKTDESIQDNSFDRMRKLAGMRESDAKKKNELDEETVSEEQHVNPDDLDFEIEYKNGENYIVDQKTRWVIASANSGGQAMSYLDYYNSPHGKKEAASKFQDALWDSMRDSTDIDEKKDKWIQKAVDPEHEGYCTPMTKKTCTPRRKALAKRFKSGDLS